MRKRVVITGLGVLAPNGTGKEAFWSTLVEGRSGIGPVTLFDASEFQCRIAGEVKDFEPHDWIDPVLKPKRRMARASQLAVAATTLALKDSHLEVPGLRQHPEIPVIMGVSTTAMDLRELPARPWSAVSGIPHAVASAISFCLGFPARLFTVSNGCASGLDALAMAMREVQTGACDLAIAGSADATLTPYVFKIFESSRKMSLRNDSPATACRPFDRDQDGGVAAEAAGVLIIENLEHAVARGAPIYAEISAYGSCADPRRAMRAPGWSGPCAWPLPTAPCARTRLDM